MSDGQTDAATKSVTELFKTIVYTEDPVVKRNPLQLAFRAIHLDDSDIHCLRRHQQVLVQSRDEGVVSDTSW